MTTTEDGRVVWKHIGLHGHSVGSFSVNESGITWKSAILGGDDPDLVVGSGTTTRFIPSMVLDGTTAKWTVFGRSGHLRISTNPKAVQEYNQGHHKKQKKHANSDTATTNTSSSSDVRHEYRFDGFPSNDFDMIRSTLRTHCSVDVLKYNMSSAGTQYGLCKVTGRNITFRHCILEDADEEGEEYEPREGEEMMSLDLAEVSQCVLPGNNRNEIELQFPESDTIEAGTDQLVAIRFYIPPDPDVDANDKTIPFPAEVLQQKIMQTASIRKTTGDVIVEFEQNKGAFLTPRGRYAIELYDWFLRMRGQKYDYKIRYDDINRLFLLPKPDEVHMAFVIALDKPIRQGQQRYQYLVLQATKDPDEVTVNLDEETLKKEYGGELQPVMRGSLSNLVAKTFKVIARKKVFIPGKFANANQQACVKCALRANEGLLYPLEKQFVFIHKPPVLIRFNEVESVEFQRYAGGQGSTRNFDLCVNLKNTESTAGQKEYVFSGIDRSDYAGLYNFLSGKKITIKNLQDDSPFGAAETNTPKRPVYNEDEIYGVGPVEGEESSEDDDYDEQDAKKDEQDVSEEDSDEDPDDFGSEVDEEDDSDLEEIRNRENKVKKEKNAATAAIAAAKASDSEPKKKDKEHKHLPKKRSIPPKKSRPDTTNASSSAAAAAAGSPSSPSSNPKRKKQKTTKDPNAPKKNLSAYMLYANSVRAQVQQDNPDAKFGEITKLVAEKYKQLSTEERSKWNQRAAKDKERFQAEMEHYDGPSSDDNDGSDSDTNAAGKRKKKAKKDPKAPKKALSSYMFFMNMNRKRIKEANPTASFGELAKIVGAEFKSLSADEKQKYDQLAEEDKVRYKNEMKDYTPSEKYAKDATSAGNKKRTTKKDPDAPKGALTSFMFFANDMRSKVKAENPSISFGDVGKMLGKMFKSLSSDEKQKYEIMAKKDKERYRLAMSEYKQQQAAKKANDTSSSAASSDDDDDSSDSDTNRNNNKKNDDSDDDDDDDSDDDSSDDDDDSDDDSSN